MFCRNCLQGYHIGECDPAEPNAPGGPAGSCEGELNCATNKNGEDASRTTIKVSFFVNYDLSFDTFSALGNNKAMS